MFLKSYHILFVPPIIKIFFFFFLVKPHHRQAYLYIHIYTNSWSFRTTPLHFPLTNIFCFLGKWLYIHPLQNCDILCRSIICYRSNNEKYFISSLCIILTTFYVFLIISDPIIIATVASYESTVIVKVDNRKLTRKPRMMCSILIVFCFPIHSNFTPDQCHVPV